MSIRPSESLLARVLAYAKDRGITVHAAALELMEMGLAPKAAPPKPAKPTPFRSRLKGEWKAP